MLYTCHLALSEVTVCWAAPTNFEPYSAPGVAASTAPLCAASNAATDPPFFGPTVFQVVLLDPSACVTAVFGGVAGVSEVMMCSGGNGDG